MGVLKAFTASTVFIKKNLFETFKTKLVSNFCLIYVNITVAFVINKKLNLQIKEF